MEFRVCDLCAGVGELIAQSRTGSHDQFEGSLRYENCIRCGGTGRDPGDGTKRKPGPKPKFGLDRPMQAAVDAVERAVKEKKL